MNQLLIRLDFIILASQTQFIQGIFQN